jgi:hypothetical protein
VFSGKLPLEVRVTRRHRFTAIFTGSFAVIVLLWAIATLWFRFPRLSPAGTEANAIILVVLWAIGPAIWFTIEWSLWKAEPGLQVGQQYARDFWIGAGAIVLLLAARSLSYSRGATLGEYVVAWNLIVEVIRILAWPILVVIGFILFRVPISAFFTALGSRASKIGVFSVSVELAALPEAQPWSGPAIDDFKAEYPTAASDSSGSLFRAVAETAHADYITVDLEEGQAWLTSRLFILAAVIPRVRTIKRIVFLGGVARAYVGSAPPTVIAAVLAKRFPWLEEAYLRAHTYIGDKAGTKAGTPTEKEIKFWPNYTIIGCLDPNLAGRILNTYLSNIRGKGKKKDWVTFPSSYSEHAEWLRSETLSRYLGADLETYSITRDPATDAVVLGKTLLRHQAAYVAILDPVGRFVHLIDRHQALDQIIRKELR